MKPEIIVAIITSASTLVAAIVSIVTNNRVLGYKIDDLVKRVDKHNQVLERVALLEQDNKAQWNRIDEIRSLLDKIRSEI